jgi:hypothetical protein
VEKVERIIIDLLFEAQAVKCCAYAELMRRNKMRWNILAVLAVFAGLYFIRWGLDTLVEWRAWFLGMSGLAFLLFGLIGVFLQVVRYRRDSATGD